MSYMYTVIYKLYTYNLSRRRRTFRLRPGSYCATILAWPVSVGRSIIVRATMPLVGEGPDMEICLELVCECDRVSARSHTFDSS